jgi:hypothetical protein
MDTNDIKADELQKETIIELESLYIEFEAKINNLSSNYTKNIPIDIIEKHYKDLKLRSDKIIINSLFKQLLIKSNKD